MNRITLLMAGIGALATSAAIGTQPDATKPQTNAWQARSTTPMPTPSTPATSMATMPAATKPAPAAVVIAQAETKPMALPASKPVAEAPPAPAPAAAGPSQSYMQDQASVARIRAQIDALLQQPSGGFYVTYYAKPAPPPYPYQRSPYEMQPQQQQQPSGYVKRDRYGNAERYVVARAGDTVYATIDRAFNSDDPQAPIFGTIHDVDGSGIQGPLDGVRVIGNIKYSSSQASIQFDRGYLADGRQVEIKGIAVSEDTARTGFAKDIDNHEVERYGSLLFATLVQGVGQVGQVLTQNNQQAMVDPNTGLLVSSQKFNPYQAAAGALLPAGQALTAVAAQNFNRPATISAPAGLGIGVVFLDPVVLPNDALFARNR